MRRALLTGLAVAAALAGCSGTGGDATEVAVVRAWSADLRAGDIGAASDRFDLPATVSNSGPPTRLVSRRAVRYFNETLPCGAVVAGIRHAGAAVVARLRLTERPGADCGTGAGQEVTVAFLVRDGRIAAWRRLRLPALARGQMGADAAFQVA